MMSPDGVLMMSFGDPRKVEEIRPFLANATRGKPIPPQRLEEIVQHYEIIGGTSFLTEATQHQAIKLHQELKRRGIEMPVEIGMLHWHPFIGETLANMAHRGWRKIIGVIMSVHRCFASWEVYERSVGAALATLPEELRNIRADFAPPIYDHPGFIQAQADLTDQCLRQIPTGERKDVMLIFTAHSIPVAMAREAGYVEQVEQSAQSVAELLDHECWMCAYQSRSGRPTDAWLEPDICDAIRHLATEGVKNIAIVPIGFVCDHVEVLYDLDVAAREVSIAAGIRQYRVATVYDHPDYIGALADSVMAVANI